MKAILAEGYGRPDRALQLKDMDKPVPASDQVLLRVRAASVNISDYYSITGFTRVFGGGMTRPKDPRVGGDVAGQIEAIGASVTRFRPGDEVFGTCRGAFAEYAVAREVRLATKPQNISFEEAAAVPVAGLTALQCLRTKANLKPGQDVAVNGASGGVGTFAVQIAKALGARSVTGVCSTRNLEQAQSIGADKVVDYTKEDFTKSGMQYDLICDIAGNRSVSDYKRALKSGGLCLVVGLAGNPILGLVKLSVLGKLGSMSGNKKVMFMGIAKIDADDLKFIADLMAMGKVRSVIEKQYSLDQVPEALDYVGEKHSRGKIVISIS